MKVKKFAAIVISAAMLTSIFTSTMYANAYTESDAPFTAVSTASDKEVFVYGDFEYILKDDDTIELTKYTQSSVEFIIPTEIDGKTVTSIGNNCFANSNVHRIFIPDTITEIKEYAFHNCELLEELSLSNNIEVLQSNAFGKCTGLKSIKIPKTLKDAHSKYSGVSAFSGCVNITEMTFEDGIEVIPSCLAIGTGIKSLTFPDSVKIISENAFENCTSLSEVTLPKNIEELCSKAFESCTGLTSITIPKTLKKAHTDYNSQGAFNKCENLTEVIFEEGIEVIPGFVMRDTGIKNIKFPDSVKEIESSAFSFCSNLTEINLPENIEILHSNAFADCIGLTSVTIPKSLKIGSDKYSSEGAFNGSVNIKEVIFEEGAELVPSSIFYNMKIEKVTIPDTVKIIEGNAFANCPNITEIKLPSQLEEIYSSAFENCTGLTSITIPKSVTRGKSNYFETGAFEGCTNLTDVTFEDGIEIIPTHIMRNTGIKNVNLPDTVKVIESGAFENCKNITEIKLPNQLEELYSLAFENCTGLTSITIPKSVTRGKSNYSELGAFNGCSNLTDVTFEDGIEAIPSRILTYSGVESVDIPDSVTVIDVGAFDNCKRLVDFIVPESVKAIGKDAFSNNIGLRKLLIPAQTEKIVSPILENTTGCVVYCYTDSAAHQYAEKEKIPYVLLDGDQERIFNEDNLIIVVDTEEDSDTQTDIISDSDTQTDVISDSDTQTDITSDSDTDTEPNIDTDECETHTIGDLDNDGIVTASDALTALRASAGMEPTSPLVFVLADIDGDGVITANDALAIIRFSAGMGDNKKIGKTVKV